MTGHPLPTPIQRPTLHTHTSLHTDTQPSCGAANTAHTLTALPWPSLMCSPTPAPSSRQIQISHSNGGWTQAAHTDPRAYTEGPRRCAQGDPHVEQLSSECSVQRCHHSPWHVPARTSPQLCVVTYWFLPFSTSVSELQPLLTCVECFTLFKR